MTTLIACQNTFTIQGIPNFNFTEREPEFIKECLKYEPDPSDVFVVSFPKCGTTWIQAIIHLLTHDLRLPENCIKFAVETYLEFGLGKADAELMSKPRYIKSHLTFDLIPYNKETKYVYVVRNPMDCCVSFYEFAAGLKSNGYSRSFDEFFEMFIRGENANGNYFDNVMSWYAHRNDDNVLFLVYEDMKRDPKESIVRIGKFLGGNCAKMVKSEEVLDKMVDLSSFSTLRHHHKTCTQTETSLLNEGRSFFRKGIVGDHVHYFNGSQRKRLLELCHSKLKGTFMLENWKNCL